MLENFVYESNLREFKETDRRTAGQIFACGVESNVQKRSVHDRPGQGVAVIKYRLYVLCCMVDY